MNDKARDPHQDLIDTLSLLTLKKLIDKDEALKITDEAKRRFPDGNKVYGQSVLWQLCKDRGIDPDQVRLNLTDATLTVLRGVLVGTITAQRLLAQSNMFSINMLDLEDVRESAATAEALLNEANGLAVAFLEAIGERNKS